MMDLMGRDLLLLLDETPEQEPPAIIRKHVEQVRAKCTAPVVYVREQVTAYNRKRLIEQRVPFIIPGNQMYLPELGLDLREYFRTPPPSKQRFRPATQSVLILLLLDQDARETTAAALAPVLGYSTMTLSRAFDELESVELAESDAIGRERVLRFSAQRPQTWERAQPWLIDPVRARHFVNIGTSEPAGLRAGQDALAHCTNLAEPRKPVIAIGRKQWSSFREVHPDVELEDRETATAEIEVWKYEPREYHVPGLVDPFSLYLSLQKTGDERVEQALDELMQQIPW
ncbi:MAG: hypothetical protein GY716_13720 [bacterium]|nr:hypothetical protein [bacterium]